METKTKHQIKHSQSTITLDSKYSNPPPVSYTNQVPVDESTNFIQEGNTAFNYQTTISSLIGIQKSQNQFGYYYNDAYSFTDNSGLMIAKVFYSNTTNIGTMTDFAAFDIIMKIDPCVLQPQVGGEGPSSPDWALVMNKFFYGIAYYIRMYAQSPTSVSFTPPATVYTPPVVAGNPNGIGSGFLTDPLYTVSFPSGFIPANMIGFDPQASTTPSTFGLVPRYAEINNNGTLDSLLQIYFMDHPNTIYNNPSGAFASGFGYHVGVDQLNNFNNFYYVANLDRNLRPVLIDYDTYRYTTELNNNTIGAGAWDVERVNFLTATNLTFTSLSGPGDSRHINRFRPPRCPTLLPSKYYTLHNEELAVGRKANYVSNNPNSITSDTVAVLPSDGNSRGEWQEYPLDIPQSFSSIDPTFSYMRQAISFLDDQGEPIYPKATRRAPYDRAITDYVAILPFVATLDMLYFLPLYWWCRPQIVGGTFENYIPSLAKCPAGSSTVNFQTAISTEQK
jgi:hypothetical protein